MSYVKKTSDGRVIKLKLYLPSDGKRYRANKLQQLLHMLDAKALDDVTKLNLKDYMTVLEQYTKLTDEIKKAEGDRVASKKTKKRMDSAGLEEDSPEQAGSDPFSQ